MSTSTQASSGAVRPERVTHAFVRDVPLGADLGTLALVTVDNGLDHTRPTTFGLVGLDELHTVLVAQQRRARAGEIVAVAVTGKPYYLAAGADLTLVGQIVDATAGRAVAERGHATFRLLGEMGVPTFAFVNGAALGGGLELALSCDYRTVQADVRALALPETYLGLVPGWGGCYLLPRLLGVAGALDLILTRPLANNRMTDAGGALAIGLVDAVLHPADFLERSIAWAADVLRGVIAVDRRPLDPPELWDATCAAARTTLDARLHGSRPAPYRALDLVAAGRDRDRDTAFAAEDDAHQVEDMDRRIEEGATVLLLAGPWAGVDDVVGEQRPPLEHARLADSPGGDEVAGAGNGAAEALCLDDFEPDAGGDARLDHGGTICDAGGHRLFDKHVLAGGGGPDHLCAMIGVRCGDEDRIDIAAGEQRGEVRFDGDAVVGGKRRSTATAGHRDEPRPCHMLSDALGMGAAHIARAQNANPQLGQRALPQGEDVRWSSCAPASPSAGARPSRPRGHLPRP